MQVLPVKNDKNRFLSIHGGLLYLIAAVVLFFIFLVYSQEDAKTNTAFSQILIFGSFIGSVITAAILFYQGKLKVQHLILLSLICGFCVKLGYAIATGYQSHQHDVESLGSKGHLQYIYQLAFENELPQTNDWQFCHPPLHHFLAALVVKLGNAFGFSLDRCFESVQYLTVFYSTVTMIWFYKILRQIGVRGRALLFANLLFAVHPTFTILAGSINNDILTVMLCTGAIYYLIRWYQEPTWLYAGVLGLLVGLAMMTKFSAAIVAAIVGVVVLVRVISRQEIKLLLQAPLFLVISLPLGLWYQIRNMRLFSQSLGYVAPLGTTSQLYTGEASLFSRLLFAPAAEWKTPFCDPWNDVNLLGYTLKSSVFGEYSWSNTGLAWLLLLFNVLMIAATVFAIVQILRKKQWAAFGTKIILLVTFFTHIAFMLYFNLRYPYGCSMDFRYMVLTLVSGIACLGLAANQYQKASRESKSSHWVMSIFGGASFGFSMMSILLFV